MDVLESKSIITASKYANLLLEFDFGEDKLVVEFRFKDDMELKNSNKYQVKPELDEDNNKIIFNCINFGSSFGIGTSEPVMLMTMESGNIYISYWIYSLGNNSARKVEYTIYHEGKSDE